MRETLQLCHEAQRLCAHDRGFVPDVISSLPGEAAPLVMASPRSYDSRVSHSLSKQWTAEFIADIIQAITHHRQDCSFAAYSHEETTSGSCWAPGCMYNKAAQLNHFSSALGCGAFATFAEELQALLTGWDHA